jgi:hypothetical protein
MNKLALFVVVAFSSLTSSGVRADDRPTEDEHFDIAVAARQVTVTTRAGWHVNTEYPWKLVVGDLKLDKTRFNFGETTASVAGAPPGNAKLMGGICSGDRCRSFKKELTIE